MRLFLAFTPPPQIINDLGRLQLTLKKQLPSVRWVCKKNLHLTIEFLGNIEEKLLPQLTSSLQKAAQESPPVILKISQITVIPSTSNPRVLALKVLDLSAPNFQNLRKNIRSELKPLGIKLKRPKPPHLTLGRFKTRHSINWAPLHITPTVWRTVSFTLFQSRLTPKGPIYFTHDIYSTYHFSYTSKLKQAWQKSHIML
ncbi:2'-5' RNA ligase [candidate division CPR3 bacterium 4484_211]|uniref:RNA 2',3'-cyclic phosphodiesterase n=1 Tax=candidate division CPR3 bacterium 4484_211 TaxID=1968527 RepID=A0A1W9NXG9_UNCC3|nr:MAG: 2'-5' RNA ligase [candidate division CPR3 bacterium 4484_211]